MPLVPRLKAAAVERGLFPDDGTVHAEAAFALVRDMPYRRASSRDPEVTIAEWRGTCSGKHILLQALLEELGLPTVMILATHEFTEASSPWLPPSLLAEVRRAPVADVHHFLRVQPRAALGPQADWMTVDATWPLAARALGLPANEAFVPGRDMTVACDPIEVHHVPPEVDPMALKAQMLAELTGEQRERREAFLGELMEWLERQLAGS
jgi:hypothetical protein